MRVGRTESVCPVCLRKLSAEKRTGADGYIYMDKQCPEHGKFSTLIWEDNLISYMRWNLGSSTVEPPVNGRDAKNGCPNDCGLCKAHLRNARPILLAVSTNDGLSGAAANLGRLLNRKHYYFVPFGQDSPEKKPYSLIADFARLPAAARLALRGQQMQPILF